MNEAKIRAEGPFVHDGTATAPPGSIDSHPHVVRAAEPSSSDGGLAPESPAERGSAPRPAEPWPSVSVERDLGRARKEWLHTNGAGAYASSTVAGMHTRRYHGLLVAALDPPRGRHVFLSHVDATVTSPPAQPAPRPARPVTMGGDPPNPPARPVTMGGDPPNPPARPVTMGGDPPNPPARPAPRLTWDLAKHQFPGVDPETTPFYLHRFDQDPLPRWTYEVAGGELEITLALVRGENAAVLRYAFHGPGAITLALRPLLAVRSFHELLHEHGGMLQRVELRPGNDEGAGRQGDLTPGEMRVQPRRDLPRICFRYEGTFVGSPDWWRRFEYLAERDRGLDYVEDLWTPGLFEVPLDGTTGAPRYLVAAVDKLPSGEPAALLEAARAALLAEDPGPSVAQPARGLTIAAEAFRADLARRPGVIAGYPWFEVWGRDTLIALPGLYLVPSKIEGALRILREMIGVMQDGLVPNRIPDAGEAPEFHTADATLWLFEAARHMADALGDQHPFVTDELLLALHDAFDAALRGTRNGIHVTAGGLFAAGTPAMKGGAPPSPQAESLTWMDARVEGRAVTPRAGCPVELTALWARACDTLARLARAAGDLELRDRAAVERGRARRGFQDRFWCAETDYPYDVISEARDGEGSFRDAAVRPNAVLALAVDPSCFTDEQADAVLARARRDLVTPAGLRTLAPGEPGYVGRYAGDVLARDRAYHQGTAWPWLLGAYVRASLRRNGDRAELAALVASATTHTLALGQVPEIADGDAPHAPAGGVAQAWSVAELLRAIVWDLGGKKKE